MQLVTDRQLDLRTAVGTANDSEFAAGCPAGVFNRVRHRPGRAAAQRRTKQRPFPSAVPGWERLTQVVDALAPRGITDMDAPATPHRVWQALQEAEDRNV